VVLNSHLYFLVQCDSIVYITSMGRDITNQTCFLSLSDLKNDYDGKRNSDEDSVASECCRYERDRFLEVGRMMRFGCDAWNVAGGWNAAGFGAKHLTEADSLSPDPCLDDEVLIAALEGRLSRESGADACNSETFGDCAGGWSFEDALKANQELAKMEQRNLQELNAWSCDSILESSRLPRRANQRPCGQPFDVASVFLTALRERGRRLLDATGTVPQSRDMQIEYDRSYLVTGLASNDFGLDAPDNVQTPCLQRLALNAVESTLRADAPCFEPPCFGPVKANAQAETRSHSRGLNPCAQCFQPGVSYAYDSASTDDAGESCGGDTSVSDFS
jgi:hypothetical protein